MAPELGLADAEAEAAAPEWLPAAWEAEPAGAAPEPEAEGAGVGALDASPEGAAAPAELMPWLFVMPPIATLEQIWP